MAAEPFIPISRSLWQSLIKKYGGGPEIRALELCSKCQTYIRAYNERKQAEFDLVSKYDTKDTGEGRYWYLVDALWVNKWKRYVRGEHVTDISDVSPPGLITNERLLDKDTGRPRANLKLRIDYIGVNARVWWLFMHVHGGGPSICREELDMYSAECNEEVELYLEELQGKGSSEYARRISRKFVDECRGDLEMYNRKYGTLEEQSDAMQVDGRDTAKGEMDVDDRRGHEDGHQLDERRLAKEVEELRRKRQLQQQELERQLVAVRAELQQSQTRQKQLRDIGGDEQELAAETHKCKVLLQRVEQKERELLAEQRSVDERIHAKEEELRRAKERQS